MGKRSNFERNERDYYPTPIDAVAPLMFRTNHIESGARFCEPCAGDGRLAEHLCFFGLKLASAYDIEPKADWIDKQDALERLVGNIDYFITNPPWDRKILHPLIEHLRIQSPTWLLFDADWMHTKQSAPYIKYCEKIVSVGRVKWIPDSKMTGKDNCAWYKFVNHETKTQFVGR